MKKLFVHGKSASTSRELRLQDGASVAVVGGGPAGSFFAYFLLELAERAGLRLKVDIYEPRNFDAPGPAGCNMCGGIISESLVQALATDGINLPPGVVQRGIESYVLHLPEGRAQIDPNLAEKRIAAVHRGGGPCGTARVNGWTFDGYLLNLAQAKGARLLRDRIKAAAFVDGMPQIAGTDGRWRSYELLSVALGVNSAALKLLEDVGGGYHPPATTRANISEIPLVGDCIVESLGNSMHVFLLDLPQVDFAALIPKCGSVTACILGENVDRATMRAFLESPEVKRCFPPNWKPPETGCHCSPKMNVGAAIRPYGDRIIYIGDCGVTRLYKDGIGSAYRTAKSAAATAVFQGVSESAFRGPFWRTCKAIERDNRAGRAIFAGSRRVQRCPSLRRFLLRALSAERQYPVSKRLISDATWDVFTGSAPYLEVVKRMLTPRVLFQLVRALWTRGAEEILKATTASVNNQAHCDGGGPGRHYEDGDVIVREGDIGDHMYVVQQGRVEVYRERGGRETQLALLGEGAIFGEMALCDHDVRSASVRASGRVRVLTVDRKTFLRGVHEDPSLSLRIVQQLSRRIRSMDDELIRLKAQRSVPTEAAGLSRMESRSRLS